MERFKNKCICVLDMASIDVKGYKEFQLDNGLLVALQQTPTKTIEGKLKVFHGGVHEREGEEGLAHFLEHCIMKAGGKKYSAEEAERVMETFGSTNACTTPADTSFLAGMLPDGLELYLDLISDIIFDPELDTKRVEQERQRVLREISDKKSPARFRDYLDFLKELYGADSPQIYPVIGDEKIISKATSHDIKNFYTRGYSPNNMQLILVGALPKNAEGLVKKYFGDKAKGEGKKYEFPRNPELKGRTILHRPAPELTYTKRNAGRVNAKLSIGLVAPPKEAEEGYAVGALLWLYGYDSNSRLFKKVSEKMGLAYNISCDYLSQNNSGIILINGKIRATRLDEGIKGIFEEMDNLKKELVDESDLARIKRANMYSLAKFLGTNEGLICAIEAGLEKRIILEEYFEKIEAITPEDIRKAANRYFQSDIETGKYVMLIRDPLRN